MLLAIREQKYIGVAFPSYTIARAYTILMLGEQRFRMGGYGCSTDPSQAYASARGELNERVWSLPVVQRALGQNHLLIRTLDGEMCPFVTPEAIAGKSTGLPFNVPSDGTGYGYHPTQNAAINHAVFELIERHLTWKTWTGALSGRPLITTTPLQGGNMSLITLQVRSIPYCLAICVGPCFLSIGAKCSPSFAAARDGAIAEAVMIYEEYCVPNSDTMPPDRHLKTIENLRNADYRKATIHRLLRFGNYTPNIEAHNGDMSSLEVLRRIGIDPKQVKIASFSAPGAYCVRAICGYIQLDSTHAPGGHDQIPML